MLIETVQRMTGAAAGLGVPHRAGILVAASGPYHTSARHRRAHRMAMATANATGHMAITAAPMLALEKVAEQRMTVDPASPEGRRYRRQAMFAGSAVALVAGVLAQRGLARTPRPVPGSDLGRLLGSEMAIGGAAGTLVLGTDALLGSRGRELMRKPALALTLGTALAMAQTRTLKRVGPVLVLPADPYLRHRPR
jgi:hypothetical protein